MDILDSEMTYMEKSIALNLAAGTAMVLHYPGARFSPDFVTWLHSNGWTSITHDGQRFEFVREADLALSTAGV
jgi:hypothetical protein